MSIQEADCKWINNRQFYLKKTIKILFTINSLKKKEKAIHSKTLFTISVDLKST